MVVLYHTKSHWRVITQIYGSQWCKILPYCIANVLWLIILTILYEKYDCKNIAITNQGHQFVTLVVSFLLVTRVNQALNRYNEARTFMGMMCKEVRDLNTYVAAYTGKYQSHDEKEWRHEVAYRSMALLQTTNAMIDYPTRKVPSWSIPELNGIELQCIKDSLLINTHSTHQPTNIFKPIKKKDKMTKNKKTVTDPNNTNSSTKMMKYQFKERNVFEESLRVPVHMSYLLRQSIESQSERLSKPLVVPVELKFHQSIDNFLTGYYGVRKFITTPVPFPLVQMARTILFLFVFTAPFVVVGDSSHVVAHCISIFMFTYGFVGLECVAIELDDPFGDDPNDFDNDDLSEMAYEDIMIRICTVDGPEWADKLRQRMCTQDEINEGFTIMTTVPLPTQTVDDQQTNNNPKEDEVPQVATMDTSDTPVSGDSPV